MHASQPAATASQIASVMNRYASASTGPLGAALPATGDTISIPCSSATSRKAPNPVPVPLKCRYTSGPTATPNPPRPNRSRGVGTGENVLVSCSIMAITTRCVMP